MNEIFAGRVLKEISAKISHALADTFRLMFALDFQFLSQPPDGNGVGEICSFVRLSGPKIDAALHIAVTRAALAAIVEAVAAPSPRHYEEAMQDVVCEIANIAGNQVRAYLNEKYGCDVSLTLPECGCYAPSPQEKSALNLLFRVDREDHLRVGMHVAAE